MNYSDWNAEKLTALSGSYWQVCTIHASVKLGIFTSISDSSESASDIAAKINSEPRATSMLLDACTSLGLLTKIDERYMNTEFSRNFLCSDKPSYMGYIIMHHHYIMDSWVRLDEAVKSGNPVRDRLGHKEDEKLESFLMGMFNMASRLGPVIAPLIDLSKCRRLLDLGGGPGTYAIHFCLKNSNLAATVFDMPTTRPFAEKTITKFEMDERIDFEAGNFLSDPLPEGFDAVWMSHILHGESPSACSELVKKASKSLNEGGLLIIHEFILENDRTAPVFPALFSLNMLLGTEGGQSYSVAELQDMLRNAGISEIRHIRLPEPNPSGIVIGIKQ
ncbi:methyltransferase [Desulforegula conservatrix]|uniref:methyltransferase n=1 Tax=Desulforegula conservatrix TaxID=153026 RepID=UPI00042308FA|nr:methyltransferase [Desulforegula conservatrix]